MSRSPIVHYVILRWIFMNKSNDDDDDDKVATVQIHLLHHIYHGYVSAFCVCLSVCKIIQKVEF